MLGEWVSKTFRYKTGCGWLYITIDVENNKPVHCFLQQFGGCTATVNSLGRVISDWLEFEMPLDRLQHTLSKITCPNCIECADAEGKSCSWIIGKTFDGYINKLKNVKTLKSPF